MNTTYSELEEFEFPTEDDEKLWGVKMIRKETIVINGRYTTGITSNNQSLNGIDNYLED